ncbi:MAG: ATP-binding protein [Pirellulaceae bacterium]
MSTTKSTKTTPKRQRNNGKRQCGNGQTSPREAFSISRSSEYLSEKELEKQLGYPRRLWHLAVVKELLDNSLDHCEEIGVLPEISISVDDEGISVQDNGAGIPPETVVGMLDFDKRVSSREAFRSLTRGAQGNAGKCLVGVPYVLNGDKRGGVTIDAQGVRHDIEVEFDQLAQVPTDKHVQTPGKVQTGTFIKVHLPDLPSNLEEDEKARFLLFGWKYAALNPHLTLSFRAFGESYLWERTASECPKWTAAEPDPPHWYDIEAFERLVGACIAKDRTQGTDRSLPDFLRGFAGLSGTAKLKAVTGEAGLTRCNLSALLNCNGLDRSKTTRLLEVMQQHGREPKAAKLGSIGREHIGSQVFRNVFDYSIRYKKAPGITSDGLPFVVEAAFAESSDPDDGLQIITGCNFSPAVDRSCVRRLDSLLEHQMVEEDSPVVLLLHIATPAPTFLDRGKSVIDATGDLEAAVEKCVVAVTSEWRKQRKLEEQDARQAERRRAERLRQAQRPKMQLNDAVVKVLPEASERASGGHVCEFSQRDFYYAARQLIQAHTDKELTQKYFDRVVDEYEKANGLIEGRLRDPRGYLLEPHTGKKIPLGTKAVDDYDIPLHLYDDILYFEKKGMESKCAWGQIPERYDCAIMACEGYAVRAAKALLQAAQRGHKMKVLCFHDADPDGYNIARTLTKGTGAHNYCVEVIDAGLHLQEALDMGLAVETFVRKKRLPRHLKLSPLEQEYFGGEERQTVGKNGKPKTVWVNCRRVELNALSADPHRFVAWVESKLEEHGCAKKLIPPKTIIETYGRETRDAILRETIHAAINDYLNVGGLIGPICNTLKRRIEIKGIPAQMQSWAEGLPPQHWRHYVSALISDSVAGLDAAIREKVAVALREVLS